MMQQRGVGFLPVSTHLFYIAVSVKPNAKSSSLTWHYHPTPTRFHDDLSSPSAVTSTVVASSKSHKQSKHGKHHQQQLQQQNRAQRPDAVPSLASSSRTSAVEEGIPLEVRLAAPPVDGKANEELIEFLEQELTQADAAIKRRRVSVALVRGSTSRQKWIAVSFEGSAEELDALFRIASST